MLLAILPNRVMAITGTVTHIDLPCATDDELAETVLPLGRMVQRSSDPKDVRIGNGYSQGGISLWNFDALTHPPTSFPHDITMDHHHVRLDGSYSINAEAGRLTAWYGTNAIWTVLASSSLASNVLLSVAPEGTNMAFTVASETDDMTVETSASLVDPVWETAETGFERLSPQTVKITVPAPAVGEMRYIRVQTEIGDIGMAIAVPLSVPSITVGGADVTSNLIASWNQAESWGNHAEAGYLTEEKYHGTIIGGTITTGETASITTNAGVLGITVPTGTGGTGISAEDATNIAQTVVAAYTNTLLLPGCAILSVDPATSNAWIGASGLYGFYTVTNNTTPWNLCISNTQYRSPHGYGIKVVSTQSITFATNMVRVGAAPTALTPTNLIAVWPHEDPAKWNYKVQAQ